MTMIKKKSRRYVFTINNYTKKEVKRFVKVAQSLKRHRYILFAFEKGEKKQTKHIQGYIELKDSQQFTFLHNYFNLIRNKEILKFHVEIAQGTQKQNLKYIQKDGDFYEFGNPKSKQGKRKDVDIVREKILENPKEYESIIKKYAKTSGSLNFGEKFVKYVFEKRDPKKPPIVFWIYGKTGIGKTKIIYETFNDIHPVSDYLWIGQGYTQNEVLLFDDFRSTDKISFNTLLKITDRYPFSLPVKNSHIQLNSKYIIFTSSKSIKETFNNIDEDINQFYRRVWEIEFKKDMKINLKEYKSKLDMPYKNTINDEDIDF